MCKSFIPRRPYFGKGKFIWFRVPGEILKSASPTTGPLGPGPRDHDTLGVTETII